MQNFDHSTTLTLACSLVSFVIKLRPEPWAVQPSDSYRKVTFKYFIQTSRELRFSSDQIAIEDCNKRFASFSFLFFFFFFFFCFFLVVFFWFVCLLAFVVLFVLFLFSIRSYNQQKNKKDSHSRKRTPARIPYLSPLFSPYPSIDIQSSCFGGIMCVPFGGASPRVTCLARSSLSYLLACVQASQAPSNCTNQTAVAQKVDSTIHWINHYALDNSIGFDST